MHQAGSSTTRHRGMGGRVAERDVDFFLDWTGYGLGGEKRLRARVVRSRKFPGQLTDKPDIALGFAC